MKSKDQHLLEEAYMSIYESKVDFSDKKIRSWDVGHNEATWEPWMDSNESAGTGYGQKRWAKDNESGFYYWTDNIVTQTGEYQSTLKVLSGPYSAETARQADPQFNEKEAMVMPAEWSSDTWYDAKRKWDATPEAKSLYSKAATFKQKLGRLGSKALWGTVGAMARGAKAIGID